MTTKTRLLIVDDSPEDCVSYQRQLRGADEFTFQLAHTSAQGLTECRTTLPDCILLDFNLPDGDGLEFLQQLRQEHGELSPAVVMLTGQGNETVAVQAMKLGAQDYLIKETANGNLRQCIHNSIRYVTLRREVERQRMELINLNESQAQLLTELKQKADDLSDADRRKNEFLAILAHELRNPLGPIRNAALIMQIANTAPSPETKLASTIIERQVAHMSRLIDDLLDVSRIVRGKVRLQLQTLDLAQLIKSTAEDYRVSVLEAGLALIVNLPDGEVWVEGDSTRISQVIGNLLDNARKFTPTGGSITISVEVSADAVLVHVADTGEGLDQAMYEHMFEVFSQADRSLDRSRGGLGLGLAIVKGIAELHGGGVKAHSDGPGRGCTITVSLPLAKAAPKMERPSAILEPAKTSLRILIVEDNKDAAHSLRILLEKLGHTVAVVYTGYAALPAAAEKLRKDPQFVSTFLIALTGYGREEDQQRAINAGFDLHLTKPIAFDILQRLPALIASGKTSRIAN
jgi:signal transduction histidine kinase